MNDPDFDFDFDTDDLERRLNRLRPADPPPVLLRRLCAVEPPSMPVSAGGWRLSNVGGSLHSLTMSLHRPWSLAYAGVLAAWLLVLMLHLATPPAPAATPRYSPTAQDSPAPGPLPASIDSFSVDRAVLLTRANLSDPWP